MKTIELTFTLEQLREAARYRPPGYLPDVMKRGSIQGNTVTLSSSEYDYLREKYRTPALPLAKWPAWALTVRMMRSPADRGVGDTLRRLAGSAGHLFQRTFQAVTGRSCRCDARRDFYNQKLPYL